MERKDATTAHRVLIVEDEWLIAMDLQDMLEEAGYQIVGPAASISEALEMIGSQSFEASLLDLHVGGQSSYGVAAELKRRCIPFAFLTGHTRADLDAEFQEEPLMSKPISGRDLTAGLEALLARKVG